MKIHALLQFLALATTTLANPVLALIAIHGRSQLTMQRSKSEPTALTMSWEYATLMFVQLHLNNRIRHTLTF